MQNLPWQNPVQNAERMLFVWKEEKIFPALFVKGFRCSGLMQGFEWVKARNFHTQRLVSNPYQYLLSTQYLFCSVTTEQSIKIMRICYTGWVRSDEEIYIYEIQIICKTRLIRITTKKQNRFTRSPHVGKFLHLPMH